MDFEQDNNISSPIEPQPAGPISSLNAGTQTIRPAKKGTGWRIFWGIVLAFSVMANFVLFLMLIGVVALFTTGQRGMFTEEVIREGPSRNKIAVITLQGVIHGQLASEVYQQLKVAGRDRHVKGLIVRVNSPGGTISASDQIYKEIKKFRSKENIPVVAFMQGVAASGGYYTSVACEKIIAEPTVITGSIGVISSFFVVQELLEEKLGVLPVTIKSGQKKDWPSSFREPAPEELQYMQEKLITPAFERFVQIVAEGRKETLDANEVRRLADGGIFGANEARDKKLIDDIGYLDEAIESVKTMAGIETAQVVAYRKPFTFADFLSYHKPNLLKLDRTTLYDLTTPQVLYLWSAY
ncbi:MAG: signal peptide peptidase SppA [Sedimentisphaerales bacterium]|nr:signal peptide peptidase SppA [Sedimentisphaerales bacterium]